MCVRQAVFFRTRQRAVIRAFESFSANVTVDEASPQENDLCEFFTSDYC